MQWVTKGRKGDVGNARVFIQSIVVVSTNEDQLWNACDKALQVLTDDNVVPYYNDCQIGKAFRSELIEQYLVNYEEETTS